MKNREMSYHQPVMLQETIDGLLIREDGTYVDATFGGGGHTRGILQRLGENGRVLGFDQDEDAWKNQPADKRFTLIPQNFRHLARFLKLYHAIPIDGLLADIGVSSYQLDTAERGFSTRFDASLDMRMDQRNELTAAAILKTYDELQLQQLFQQYGEITNAKTLARSITEARRIHPLEKVEELKAVIAPVVKGNPQRYFAQVFQALRIEVNDELGALRELLRQAATVLKPGGRLVIITFHSLEDRIVKNFIRTGQTDTGEETPDPFTRQVPEKPFRSVIKKPVLASAAEIRLNPRARSAKLRIAEKNLIHSLNRPF